MDTSKALLDYYDRHLAEHGDSALGAAWPNEADRILRFRMGIDLMLAHAGDGTMTVCDLGCGTGELLRHLRDVGLDGRIRYVGVDRSETAIALARSKFPQATFHCLDVESAPPAQLDRVFDCDFVFANGLFTVKHTLTHEAMWRFMTEMLLAAWPRVRRGVVFNVMSTLVDWERDDLFHVPYDAMGRFLRGLGGEAIGFQAHRDLYEYMAYALKPRFDRATHDAPSAGATAKAGEESISLPVCRPKLPPVHAVAPYLALADRTRRYSNHGSLSMRLTQALAERIDIDGVCLASSGTTALVGAILASAGRATPQRPLALVPAYTFVATAHAVELAGYTPVLVDIDEATWALTPTIVASHPLERVGLVVATAPYGARFPQRDWTAFSRSTGIPVVVDAAAGFESICADPAGHVGEVPVVLSLHATKAFGAGEGGVVLCTDRGIVERAYAALNFGFRGSRECVMPGLNGKMSEYHAAVALAELDSWENKRAGYGRVAEHYRGAGRTHGLEDRLVVAPDIASCYALFVGHTAAETGAVERALRAEGLDCRRWYGTGLQDEPYLRNARHAGLATTLQLAPRILGLPMATDLAAADIERVMAAVAVGVGACRRADRADEVSA